jgi:hypothetical protein
LAVQKRIMMDLDGIDAPSNISALTTITQDNSGNVTSFAKRRGSYAFEIYYGDGTVAGFVNWEGKYLINTKKVNFKQNCGITINGKKQRPCKR